MADRRYPGLFLHLVYKRAALSLVLRDSLPAYYREIRAALNESANELGHTR